MERWTCGSGKLSRLPQFLGLALSSSIAASLALSGPCHAEPHHRHHHRHHATETSTTAASQTADSTNTASTSSNADSTGAYAGLVMLGLVGLGGAGTYVVWSALAKANKRVKRDQKQNTMAMKNFESDVLMPKYPFILRHSRPVADMVVNDLLCMDREGSHIRMICAVSASGLTRIASDVPVAISDIVSIDVKNHETVTTETLTQTKRHRPLARAAVGELIGGSTGALVGVISAKSTSTSVGLERRTYQASELIFGLNNLANPVVRFTTTDRVQAEQWMHRIRTAMLNARSVLSTSSFPPIAASPLAIRLPA